MRRQVQRSTLRSATCAVALAASACSQLTEPPGAELRPAPPPSAVAAASAARPTIEKLAAPPPALDERVTASHVLVAYKGSAGAAPTITRTKDEAKARAQQVTDKARAGADFAGLARDYSDEPNAAARGGALGAFTRQAMVKPFSDAAFALKPGEISGVVETQFGFHVIKRTQ